MAKTGFDLQICWAGPNAGPPALAAWFSRNRKNRKHNPHQSVG
jgi:hypothetical protein